MELPREAEALLAAAGRGSGRLLFLTGAGVSAASGIPTFRGPEGFWTVGSRHYTPQEMATLAMFRRRPEAVWAWYLYRRHLCLAAEPNPGHRALAVLEEALGDRFRLITQNVDGLHRRAGNSSARTYEIHGNLHWARCSADCPPGPRPLPPALRRTTRGETLSAAERQALTCPACGSWLRPHVLWFDECYDETNYRASSALRALEGASLLCIVGTSGATTLPWRLATLAAERRVPIIEINPEATPFTRLAAVRLAAASADALPAVAACLARAAKHTAPEPPRSGGGRTDAPGGPGTGRSVDPA